MNTQKSNQPNIWATLAGPGGGKWQLFKNKNIVAAHFGDYDGRQNYQTNTPTEGDKCNEKNVADIKRFVEQIQIDDIIIAYLPLSDDTGIEVYGIGKIISEYIPPNAENNPSDDKSYGSSGFEGINV
jgi:hypothetical protein